MAAAVGDGSSLPSKYQRLNNDEDEDCWVGKEHEYGYWFPLWEYLPYEDDPPEFKDEYKGEDEDEDEDDEVALRLLSSTDEPGPMKDADAPRLLPSVDRLPDGAWELWGSQAIYFTAEDVGAYRHTYKGNMVYSGLSIYVINPTDQLLPVYHLFDFSFPLFKSIHDLTCAIVGSLAYVAGNGRLWMRQIGGDKDKDPGCWVDGPPYDMYNFTPLLFSLGGTLHALCYFKAPDPCSDPTPNGCADVFQVLVDGSWRSLNAPPPCFWCSPEPCEPYFPVGWSCVGDHTLIVHVEHSPTAHQRFYCFRHTDTFSGKWTELDVTPSPSPSLCDHVVYAAHLGSNNPLLLPLLSRTTMSPVFFRLTGDILHLEEVGREVKLPWEQPQHNWKHELCWNLISMGGNRYCAFSFPNEGEGLDIDIFTFDLRLDEDDDDGAAPSVKIVHSQQRKLGIQKFRRLLCGKAHFSSN